MTDDIRQRISTLMEKLGAEPEWTRPIESGFEWWPGPLAQRIRVEDVDEGWCRLCVETDFIRLARITDRQLALLAFGNRLGTFSAVVRSREEMRLRLHASVTLSPPRAKRLSKVKRLEASIFASFIFLPSSHTSTVMSGLSSPDALR